MKLIGSHASPYTRKVRVVLAEKKIDYKFVLEDVWNADTQIHQFNPLGKVPCLVMDDGGALFDSSVIAEYADTLSPVARLIPPSGRERVEVRCWEALAGPARCRRHAARGTDPAHIRAANPGSPASTTRSTRRSRQCRVAWPTRPGATATT